MKKMLLLASVALLSFARAGKTAYVSESHPVKVNKIVEGTVTDNSKFTPEFLNGQPAFFKTYEDFLNGTGLKWTLQTYDIGYTFGNKFSKFEAVFKDEAGKKVKVSTSDFWGWRSANGELWRNGDFVNGNITKIPFLVHYVATDHVIYHPEFVSNSRILPHEWASSSLESPISDMITFFRRHPSKVHDRLSAFEMKCMNGTGKAFQGGAYDKLVAKCVQESPDIISLYIQTSSSKGTFVK